MSYLDKIPEQLFHAEETRQPMNFISHVQTFDESTAYHLQNKFIDKKSKAKSEQVKGYKISMTSPETQALANTHEPAYGTLLTSNVLEEPVSLSLNELFEPLLEPEVIFTLKDDLPPHASLDEIREKSEVKAGLEVPDSRFHNWFPNFGLIDLISDNAFTGKVITSKEKQDATSISQLEQIRMDLFYNDRKIAVGHSSQVMGNPLVSVQWLVKKLAIQGKTLKKGMIISSGTFISPIPLEKGNYTVSFSGIGSLSVTITE
ncbi:2-keto-4-pentenoate hydratase [Alteribacter populi]|uniref:2-keto-4-pentenoate hydratase n=1 Tax=Alteribacter populi TaxID=2011011 RepID=UPI000BBAA9A8|nr:2-keto-4-pentenoate hydratase [Alteribacter populi]